MIAAKQSGLIGGMGKVVEVNIVKTQINHLLSTLPGQSGAPIFSID